MENKSVVSKVINIVLNVFLVLIILAALFVLMLRTSLFGVGYYGVLTDSMDGGYSAETDADGNYYPPSFKPGDLIFYKKLKGQQKKELKPGQIISFYALTKEGHTIINTHRIMHRVDMDDGGVVYYTAGDKVLNTYANNGEKKDSISEYFFVNHPSGVGYDDNLSSDNVIGVYSSKIKGLGGAVNFMQSKSGFLTLVVVPCAILLIYSLYMFISAFSKYSSEKQVAIVEGKKDEELASMLEEEKEKIRAELMEQEREKIRAELLAEAKNDKNPDGDNNSNDGSNDG